MLRSFALPLVVVAGLGFGLATLETSFGLFTQTYQVAGSLATASGLAPEKPAAVEASDQATPTPGRGIETKRTATPTPAVTSTAATGRPTATATPARDASKPAATATRAAVAANDDDETKPRATSTAVRTPTSRPAATASATGSPTLTATASATPTATTTSTATATACVDAAAGVRLSPDTQTLDLTPRLTAKLSLEGASKALLARGAVLRLTAVRGAAQLSAVVIRDEQWSPDSNAATHDWRIDLADGSTALEVLIETQAGAATDATLQKASPRTEAVELRFELIVVGCAGTQEVASKATLTLTPRPVKVEPVPAPVKPLEPVDAKPVEARPVAVETLKDASGR